VRVLLFYLFTLPVLAQSIITIDMRKFTAQEIEGVYDFALSVRYDKKLFMNMTEAINGLSGMQNWNVLKKRQFLYLVYDDSIESYLTYILKLRNINFKNSYDGIQDVLNTLLAKIEESNQSIDQIINDELRGGFTTKSKSIGNIKGYFSLPTDELSKRVLKGYYAKIPYVLASTDDVTLLNIFYKFVDDYIELEKKT
jgi:N12 class adenine-specific DNA methylase